ncbi:MAG: DUF2846 domain-containing protein [Acidobacteriota bacterium]
MRSTPTTVLAVTLLGVALMAGCSSSASRPEAAPTPAPEPTPAPAAAPATADTADAGFIVVYRQKRIVGLALNTSVYLDGTETAELDPGTYVRLKAAPGTHRMWADEEKDAVEVTIEAGKTLYFRMDLVPGLWKGHGKMAAMSESAGAAEFASFELKRAEKIRAPGMVAW